MHRWPEPFHVLLESRSVVTPGGEYLLVACAGKGHYGGHPPSEKRNDLFAYRSADKGRSWAGPRKIWDVEFNQHGFVPLIPRGGSRIYAFGTQPMAGRFNGVENAVIGFRHSDDDGHTWSDLSLVEPVNDPGFEGMSVIHMAETDAGTWLLGSHTGTRYFEDPETGRWTTRTRQYILRSADRGKTWALLPGPRPGGWCVPEFDRMDEIRPIALGGGEVFALARTCEGHLWETRSKDDGRTWADPSPSPLVHPDAPAMLFGLSDGSTLACFHHNRATGTHFSRQDRGELWVSLSGDGGRSWSQPRFVLANADADETGPWPPSACHTVSYVDLLADHGELHLFVPHRGRQLLQVRFAESDLAGLPTRRDLSGR